MKSDPWQGELHETQWVTVREGPNSGKVTPQFAQSGGKPGSFRATEKSALTNVARHHLKTKIQPNHKNKGHCWCVKCFDTGKVAGGSIR